MRWTYNYYYTLEEALRVAYDNPYDEIKHLKTQAPGFKEMVNTFYSPLPSWASTTTTEYEYLQEIWSRVRHLFKRNGYYFYVSPNEYDVTVADDLYNLRDEVRSKAIDFIETFYDTKDKYIALIKAQASLESELTSDLTQTTKSYFNDTPQTTNTGYVSEDYTTTFNRTVQEIPLGNVAEKLAIVRASMEDIYDEWVNEFKRFVIFD